MKIKSGSSNQERPLRTKSRFSFQYIPQAQGQHLVDMPKKSYWHHFDEEEDAWPKVVLILTSTEKLTTKRITKRTFASYFPNLRYTSTEYSNFYNQEVTRDNSVLESSKSGMNSIQINFETYGDKA